MYALLSDRYAIRRVYEQRRVKINTPHRDNMLLLDEAERDGNVARGKVTIRGDEWFLHGHFPEILSSPASYYVKF